VNKTHVIRLYPTVKQEIFFKKSCGVARFAYNWALNRWNQLYQSGEKTNVYKIIKELVSIKRTEFPWMLEVGKCAPQYAIYNVEAAYKAFFRKQNKRPKFHKKGRKDSFTTIENCGGFKQKDFKIHIPRLGWVKCAENLRFEGRVNNVVIKRTVNMWFAVVNINVVEKEISNETPIMCKNQAIVGVDLGIKLMAVTSNGKLFINSKALKKNLKQLKRLQRRLSKKQKGSKNKAKAQTRLSRKHYRISCIRKNAIHKATTKIVNSADVIVLEDLNVKGLLKNHNLAQAISDVSLSEFRRQIEYKAVWLGKEVIIADRYFASSKTCSCCGNVKTDLKLSDRIYKCSNCGLKINRDMNAAKNLANYGSTLKASGSQAFGVGSSVSGINQKHSPSKKKELKLNFKTIKN
jgi:putative transposase